MPQDKPKETPEEVTKLRSIRPVGLNQQREGLDTVAQFLARFGYLADAPQPAAPPPKSSDQDPGSTAREETTSEAEGTAVLDETMSLALARYQERHGLWPSGVFDEDTRQMMSMSRCGFPDVSAVASSITCTWNKDALTYAFESGTGDVAGDEERAAVRRAFATWSAAAQISFREIANNDSPDIRIAWKPANCGDASMVGGVLAHADYPPGCGYYGNALPRPLHFDDQEHAWCIGTVADQFDVETIALHEVGHILGLAHSTVGGAVMFPTVSPNWTNRVLAPDDIEGIRRLYPLRGPIFARHSGRCLDISGQSAANGADAIQWEYWGGQNQIFRVEWVESSHYRLIAQHSARVLDVEAASTANGAQIHQWDWWGGDNQKFRLDPVGHGYYRLVAKHSGLVADVAAASAGNGARIIQWPWHGGNNQHWRLGPAPIFARHSGKALDVSGISLNNGAPLIQWPYWGGGNQKLRLDPVGGGYYRIMVEHSGKCLDVTAHSTANGAQIQQWEYWGGDNQKFKAEPTGDGYYRLVAKHSGKCLDVHSGSANNGATIIQWPWHGGANQQWRL